MHWRAALASQGEDSLRGVVHCGDLNRLPRRTCDLDQVGRPTCSRQCKGKVARTARAVRVFDVDEVCIYASQMPLRAPATVRRRSCTAGTTLLNPARTPVMSRRPASFSARSGCSAPGLVPSCEGKIWGMHSSLESLVSLRLLQQAHSGPALLRKAHGARVDIGDDEQRCAGFIVPR